MVVGDGVLDIPTAVRRQFGMRVVEDADPYDYVFVRLQSSMGMDMVMRRPLEPFSAVMVPW